MNGLSNKLLRLPLLVGALLLLYSCATAPGPLDEPPAYLLPHYPLFLVHGIGFANENLTFDYWDGVTPVLDELGMPWFASNQPAFGMIETNAAILKEDILAWLAAHPGVEKVNIVAHSRGGLESRWMTTHLGMGDKVASISMLSTPHRGSPIANLIFERIDNEEHFLARSLNTWLALRGESETDAYASGLQLTSGNMAAFNQNVPDVPGVYYQSWAAVVDETFANPLWTGLARIVDETEGPNDGLVSIESARWGEWRGALPGVSHAGIINLKQFDRTSKLDMHAFYVTLLADLAARGL